MTSLPVMSDGIKSGVNWIRLNESSSACDSVLTISVLAKPGTPISSAWLRQKIAGNIVWLASSGGDIDAAMVLGRILRRFGLFTLVGRDEQCMSACVFAFMGGERRTVAGQLGIHRPFFPTTQVDPDRQVRYRLLQKALRDYIDEMDFPHSLYEAVMVVPPESIKILAPAELKRFYLDGISPSSEDLADATSAKRLGLSMAEYLKRKAQGGAQDPKAGAGPL